MPLSFPDGGDSWLASELIGEVPDANVIAVVVLHQHPLLYLVTRMRDILGVCFAETASLHLLVKRSSGELLLE